MKKSTYKAIDHAAKALRALNLEALLKLSELQDERDMARNDYEDKSEAAQTSDAGVLELERVEALEACIDEVESAISSLRTAVENIEIIENNAPEGAFN